VPQGPRHCPIAHSEFVDEVEGELVAQGYELRDTAFGVTKGGDRFFGLANVVHQDLRGFDGGEFVIGFRGSHDQSLPRGLAGGSRVFVCDNLAFSGELVLHTKQTTNIHQRLPILLQDMVHQLGTTLQHQVKQFDAYRTTRISQSEANDAILELGRRNVVNWSELGKVVDEWDNPSHDEHAEDGDTVWRLFNAATETLKIRNPAHPRVPLLVPKTTTLHRICDQLSELPLAA
jgi:hypothetical protein